tara:strand:+ start:190 stop:522 length:333 start_codon:yes stop_codon:yes gene_type:complete
MNFNNRKRKADEVILPYINHKKQKDEYQHLNYRINNLELMMNKLLIGLQNVETSLKYLTKNKKKDDMNLNDIKKIVDEIEIKSNLLDEKFYGSVNQLESSIEKENNSYFT